MSLKLSALVRLIENVESSREKKGLFIKSRDIISRLEENRATLPATCDRNDGAG